MIHSQWKKRWRFQSSLQLSWRHLVVAQLYQILCPRSSWGSRHFERASFTNFPDGWFWASSAWTMCTTARGRYTRGFTKAFSRPEISWKKRGKKWVKIEPTDDNKFTVLLEYKQYKNDTTDFKNFRCLNLPPFFQPLCLWGKKAAISNTVYCIYRYAYDSNAYFLFILRPNLDSIEGFPAPWRYWPYVQYHLQNPSSLSWFGLRTAPITCLFTKVGRCRRPIRN